LTFNNNASQALVNETLDSIAYSNSGNSLPYSVVDIDWAFSDGNKGAQGDGGALTAVAMSEVVIQAPPTNLSATSILYHLPDLSLMAIDGFLAGEDSTHVQLVAGSVTEDFYGFGLVYDRYGRPIAGTMTSLIVTDSTGVAWRLTGLHLDAAAVYGDLVKGSIAPRFFSGNDLIRGALTDDSDLAGWGGDDLIIGGSGSDTAHFQGNRIAYVITNTDSGYSVSGGSDGTDRLVNIEKAAFGDVSYVILGVNEYERGNDKSNRLSGAGGTADTLVGGKGDDTYLVDGAGDAVIEAQGEGIDLVKVSIPGVGGTYVLTDNVENAILASSVAYNLTGNNLDNRLTGNNAANTLVGGGGIDTLVGLNGDDTYGVNLISAGSDADLVAKLQDTIVEGVNGGTDTVQLHSGNLGLTKATTLVLGANLENLDASDTGVTLLNLTGNALNNIITGNAEDNVLNGGAGTDTLIGGAGNDTYVIDSASDVVIDSRGTDLVKINIAKSGGTYVLPDKIEFGTIISQVAYNLNGNALDNTLVGNGLANSLSGGAGQDTLTGGLGADTFVFRELPADALHSDVITDFTHGVDHIALDAQIFSSLTFNGKGGSLTPSQFVAGGGLTAATTTDTMLIYDSVTGNLYYDADGSGSAANPLLVMTLGGAGHHPDLITGMDFRHI
jgi:Ca2+-binding RTX toxin-like protein